MNCGKRLKKGDTIGVIAPASFGAVDKIDRAANFLTGMGYYVQLGKSCKMRWYSFAGRDEARLADLHEFFENSDIDALICLRGGYGCLRLIEGLNLQLIKANPKIFMGYSDVTVLHLILNQHADLITFHGPMLISNIADDFDIVTQRSFEKVLQHETEKLLIGNWKGEDLKSLRGGQAEGAIIGGNLTTIVSMLGTRFEPDFDRKILFIEEVDEPVYRIDRMLTQLLLSGKFKDLRGIIIGDFRNCGSFKDAGPSLLEVFQDRLFSLGVPIINNLHTGHCHPMITLPLGAWAKIDGDLPRIEILERVVCGN